MWTNQADPYRLEPQTFIIQQTRSHPQIGPPNGVCDLKVVKLLISFLAAKIRAYMIR